MSNLFSFSSTVVSLSPSMFSVPTAQISLYSQIRLPTATPTFIWVEIGFSNCPFLIMSVILLWYLYNYSFCLIINCIGLCTPIFSAGRFFCISAIFMVECTNIALLRQLHPLLSVTFSTLTCVVKSF